MENYEMGTVETLLAGEHALLHFNDFLNDLRGIVRISDERRNELRIELQQRIAFVTEQFVGMKATADVRKQAQQVVVNEINSFLSEKELIMWHGVDKVGYGRKS